MSKLGKDTLDYAGFVLEQAISRLDDDDGAKSLIEEALSKVRDAIRASGS